MSNQTVPATYADPKLLGNDNAAVDNYWSLFDESTYSAERLLFLSENCRKLADFLCDVPDTDHDQRTWTYHSERSTCGTVGCAMGWAALAHVVPGLQYLKVGFAGIEPAINGKRSNWGEAPVKMFGTRASENIFHNISASRIKTINALYRESERLCELHKKKKGKK